LQKADHQRAWLERSSLILCQFLVPSQRRNLEDSICVRPFECEIRDDASASTLKTFIEQISPLACPGLHNDLNSLFDQSLDGFRGRSDTRFTCSMFLCNQYFEHCQLSLERCA